MSLEPLPIAHTVGHNNQYNTWQKRISLNLQDLDNLVEEMEAWIACRSNEWCGTERATKLSRDIDTLERATDLLGSLNIRKAP
jgi:hypothetical protein